MQKLFRSRGIFSITIVLTILLLLSIASQSYATNKDTERLQQIQEKSSIENPPEDLVGIPQYKISTTKSYGIETFDIDGQIQNRGEDELFGTQIIATFFDEGGKFLGSEYGSISVDPVPPGQTVSFKIQ